MPISLDYDASGFQINALPSCTGHNWTLQAGGVITRQRVGNYDDFVFPKQAIANKDFLRNVVGFIIMDDYSGLWKLRIMKS